MTSFTRMHWTGVEPISTPSARLAARAAGSPSLTLEALRRERVNARRVANLKWMCVGGGISWIGFILLSL